MKRRDFLKGIGVGTLTFPSLITSSCSVKKKKQGRPNILFIMSDDHAVPAISAYNGFLSDYLKTPNIDRIADEGIRFDNCFCTNSICTPSRASVLTGKYSHKNGVYTLADEFDGTQQIFIKMLHKSGYYTGIVGKWHLKTQPTGFDYYIVLCEQGEYFNPRLKETGKPWQDGDEGGIVHEGYCTDVITDVALRFLENRPTDKPFCLLLHHKAPHDVWEYDEKHAHMFEEMHIPEPENLLDTYENRAEAIQRSTQKISMIEPFFEESELFDDARKELEGLPETQKIKKAFQYYIKAYMRCVAAIDDNVGRVLDYLDKNNLTENTIVIYTSDQGFFLGEHGLFDKRFMYEESLRVPFVVRYPKEIKQGTTNTDLVIYEDFAETFLDYAGISIPNDMQGKSLRSLFKGSTPEDWRTSIYYRYWMHFLDFQ